MEFSTTDQLAEELARSPHFVQRFQELLPKFPLKAFDKTISSLSQSLISKLENPKQKLIAVQLALERDILNSDAASFFVENYQTFSTEELLSVVSKILAHHERHSKKEQVEQFLNSLVELAEASSCFTLALMFVDQALVRDPYNKVHLDKKEFLRTQLMEKSPSIQELQKQIQSLNAQMLSLRNELSELQQKHMTVTRGVTGTTYQIEQQHGIERAIVRIPANELNLKLPKGECCWSSPFVLNNIVWELKVYPNGFSVDAFGAFLRMRSRNVQHKVEFAIALGDYRCQFEGMFLKFGDNYGSPKLCTIPEQQQQIVNGYWTFAVEIELLS